MRARVVLVRSRLDPGDVGGKELDAVAVKVSAGPVVVICGAWVGVSGEDLGVAQRDAGVEGVVMAAWRSECGPSGRRLVCRWACRTRVSG